jgi:WD40 repeat protein
VKTSSARALSWAFAMAEVLAQGQDQARVRLHVQSGRVQVASMVFSPDDRSIVTTGGDGAVRLWDVAAGREVGRLETADPYGPRVLLSRDGRTILISTKDGVALWDLTTGHEVHRYSNKPATALGFSPDGGSILVASANGYSIWDLMTARRSGVSMVFP